MQRPLPQGSPQSSEASGAVHGEIRRRKASLRNPPMLCGRRDPLDTCREAFLIAPVVMGLNPDELNAEALRLQRAGWGTWEIRKRLGLAWRGSGRP